ncbi:MAG: hypothetical protein IKJ11_04890 [Clostridia bacterium]|nr:hypothetical protein [Clostridia bacterium]
MAGNTFDALMTEVNLKIAQAGTAISQANASAAKAMEAADAAGSAAADADAAADHAGSAAAAAQAEAEKWEGATVDAAAIDAQESAGIALSEKDGVKHLVFSIPRGRDGAAGTKGDTGRSGVAFSLSGTKLYISTD